MTDLIVADASVLIALAKMQRLSLLRDLYGEVLMGPVVKAETVDAGKEISAPGVHRIEKAIADGWVRVIRPSAKEKKAIKSLLAKSSLDDGEAEAIALASSRKLTVILDDKEARAFAEISGAQFRGTAAVLLEAYIKERLTFDEFEDAIRDLTKVLWLAPSVVSEILKAAREAKK